MQSVMGQNNGDYCQGTSKWKVHQGIPQSQIGQAASLETEKGNNEKDGVKQHASNSCENHSLLPGNLFQLLKAASVSSISTLNYHLIFIQAMH